MKIPFWPLAIALAVAGCSAKDQPVKAAPGPSPAQSNGANVKPPEPVTSASKMAPVPPVDGAKTGEQPETAQAPVAQNKPQGADKPVPQQAKSDAYDYSGLGNAKPMDLEVDTPDQGIKTGSQSVTYDGLANGAGVFTVSRTGGLAEVLGATEHLLSDRTGVYTTSTSIGKLAAKHLELPVGLKPGKTWKTTAKLTAERGVLNERDTSRVVGIQTVKTPVGSYQALLIETTSDAEMDSQKIKTRLKAWYVKGKGPVKFEVTTQQGNKSQTYKIMESKPGGR